MSSTKRKVNRSHKIQKEQQQDLDFKLKSFQSDEPPVQDNSDSSEDERAVKNTIGKVPLKWYKDEDHIGYGIDGQKLPRRSDGKGKDKLDQLLERNDDISKALRTVYDEYNDEEIVLTKDELRMLLRIRKGHFPHLDVNMYEEYNDWYTKDVMPFPLINQPEPKRRFTPSKWEEKRIVKLVRAIRRGWIKKNADQKDDDDDGPPLYLMWEDDGHIAEKTSAGITYIAPPKPRLPGHKESYNPPLEYMPDKEDEVEEDDNGNPIFEPKVFESLRKVPAYSKFINERFERCLDLYLAPRAKRKVLQVKNSKDLLPQLPKIRDLQPFPQILFLTYKGHQQKVTSICLDNNGQNLISGSSDGCVCVWEISTARRLRTYKMDEPVSSVCMCPTNQASLLGICSGSRITLVVLDLVKNSQYEEAIGMLQQAVQKNKQFKESENGGEGVLSWVESQTIKNAVEIKCTSPLLHLKWQPKGDYFCTISQTQQHTNLMVHQLSTGMSQAPFRNVKGRISCADFHPTKPFFFVASQHYVHVYNLAKQGLVKKLVGGGGNISSMAVHESGDHVLVGSDDNRVAWYDLDLSTKPYKVLRNHKKVPRGVAFHPRYPLFATCSDDATTHIFHGQVYADLMSNPLIVPVQVLRGHEVRNHEGVLDCCFHPKQPWIFTAGADSTINLYINQ